MQFIRNSIISEFVRNILKMSERRVPLVVIIGATGCAKTKLSVQLAKHLETEIISADSMQVYKGLDIITNKATPEERQLISHHLIDFLDPLQRFSVVDFRNKALKVIEELMAKNKVPILCGGTNYYIESVLWKVLIQTNDDLNDNQLVFDRELKTNCSDDPNEELTKDNIFSKPILSDSFEDISSNSLHQILQQLDPKTALYVHPNDRRKVIRSLQIYQQNKRPKSELIDEQKGSKGGSQLGGALRFENSVILWVDCQKSALNERLDQRVDEMIERGLIEELLDFHQRYNRQRISQNLCADYSKGIFQSIGFKEFHNYLLLTEEQRTDPTARRLLSHGIDSLKSVTKRYVNYQLKWIRNRFLISNDREVPLIYRLNTTDPELWTQQVLEPSIAIVNAYINGTPVPEHIKPEPKIEMIANKSKPFQCQLCDKRLSGLDAYDRHLRSKGHKYQLKHKLNVEKQEYYELLSTLTSHENNLSNNRQNSN